MVIAGNRVLAPYFAQRNFQKGLLVRLVRVKLAPDEAIVGAHVLKQGGSVKSWRRRYATLDGDGYLR